MFPQITPRVYKLSETQLYSEAFHREGYTVIEIPISSQAVQVQFVKDLQQINSDITLENLWSLKQGQYYPDSRMNGLIGEYGMSQCDSAWMVRTNHGIQSVFQNLLNCKDLVCSMDAIGFSTDNEVSTNLRWLHIDQNKNLPGGEILSIQSIFYAEDVPEDPDGLYACTVLVPGSHISKGGSSAVYGKSHFCMMEEEEKGAVRLRIKAGQLLVFNSYLVHQGWHGRHRLCYMVSYGKKSDRTEEARRRKVLMYLCGHRSTHWSQYGHLHGYKYLPDESWPWRVVKPTLRDAGELSDWDLFESDLYDVGTDWYSPEYDNYIPVNRLVLL